jgi:hypothetical protein
VGESDADRAARIARENNEREQRLRRISAMKEELRRPGNRARKRLSNRQIRSWEQSVFEDF